MIWVIAKKEILELRRDGRFLIAVPVLWLLILSSFAVGVSHYSRLTRETRQAGQDERARWLDQGNKYPHAAAHYGIFAFKSARPLAVFDSGIEPYLGSSVWLEAHKQNEMLYRPAEDATALQRFGDLTMARLGQELLPLLIIVISYAAFAGEREAGTLRQLLSLGTSRQVLLLGKAVALGAGLLVLCLPMLVLLPASAVFLAESTAMTDELKRSALLVLAYGVYLSGFLFLTLAVSAWCRSSRSALVILLVFWAGCILVAPRALSDGARLIFPTGATIDMRHQLDVALKETGTHLEEKRNSELLAKYHVDKLEDLPFDYWGVALQDDEEGKYQIFEKKYARFYDVLRRQAEIYQVGTLVSPLAGLQLISMALAGSDVEQHRDFIRQAEANRRVIHTMINEYILKHSVRNAEGQWNVEAGRELWETIPPFQYRPADWTQALSHCTVGFILLGLWLTGSLAAALRAVARINPL